MRKLVTSCAALLLLGGCGGGGEEVSAQEVTCEQREQDSEARATVHDGLLSVYRRSFVDLDTEVPPDQELAPDVDQVLDGICANAAPGFQPYPLAKTALTAGEVETSSSE